MRSTFGKNCRKMCMNTGVEVPNLLLKNMIHYFPINDCDHWRVNFISELLDIQNSNMFIDFDKNEVNDLLLS